MGAPIAPRPRKAMVGMRGGKLASRRGEGQGTGESRLRIADCAGALWAGRIVKLASPPPSSALMRTSLRLDLPSVHAVRAVYTALQGVEGIVQADVSRRGATIEHDGRATAELLREAVSNAGYEVIEVIEERRRLTVKEVEVVEDVEVIEDLPRHPGHP